MARTKAALWTAMAALCAEMAQAEGARGGAQAATGSNGGGIATDTDLDGQYGRPEIKRDPPRWTGATMVGRHYDECPSTFLIVLADFLDWKADKDEEKANELGTSGETETANAKLKFARFARMDAKRARGWARRNDGKDTTKAKGEPEPGPDPNDFGGNDFNDDDIPF